MRGTLGLLVAAALLAGCQGNPPAKKLDAVLDAEEPAAPQTFPLRVLVINDEYMPVGGATVHVVGLGLNATTGPGGEAFFQIAKAGRYSVHTHSHGYYPNITKIDVDGIAQVKRVWLRDAPHDGRFADFYYYSAVCEAVAYADPVLTDGTCPPTPYMSSPVARWILLGGLQSAVIDLDWIAQPGGTDTMRLEVRFPEVGAFADGRSVLVAEGESPVRVTIPPELITGAHQKNGVVAEVRAGLSHAAPGVNLHQPFHFEAEFDYFIAAPDVQRH